MSENVIAGNATGKSAHYSTAAGKNIFAGKFGKFGK